MISPTTMLKEWHEAHHQIKATFNIFKQFHDILKNPTDEQHKSLLTSDVDIEERRQWNEYCLNSGEFMVVALGSKFNIQLFILKPSKQYINDVKYDGVIHVRCQKNSLTEIYFNNDGLTDLEDDDRNALTLTKEADVFLIMATAVMEYFE